MYVTFIIRINIVVVMEKIILGVRVSHADVCGKAPRPGHAVHK